MTRIFLAQTPASAAFAEQLRQELRTKGYTLPEYPPIEAISAPEQIERALIGSAAVVLLWESSATPESWVALHIGTAQRFQKPLFPILLDATPLPDALAALPTLSGPLPTDSTIVALLSLPAFPSARSVDPLQELYAEATQEIIRRRRAAIQQAAIMLAQDQHRDALLLLLTYLAEHDPITNLQREAAKVLLADAQRSLPAQPRSPIEAALMVGGCCAQGHRSYYNKRLICQQYREIVYAPKGGEGQKDELIVPCRAAGCSSKAVIKLACGAYR